MQFIIYSLSRYFPCWFHSKITISNYNLKLNKIEKGLKKLAQMALLSAFETISNNIESCFNWHVAVLISLTSMGLNRTWILCKLCFVHDIIYSRDSLIYCVLNLNNERVNRYAGKSQIIRLTFSNNACFKCIHDLTAKDFERWVSEWVSE